MPAWLPPGGGEQPKSAEMNTPEHQDIPLGDRVNLHTLPSSRRSKVPASMKIGSRLAETRPQSSGRLVYCSYARRHELHTRHALDGRCGVSSLPALLLT